MKILLPEPNADIQYYRANLHCHSNISDGKKTPQELKKFYLAHGYSILAYTDHNVFVPHNDLTDSTFLALNGFELDVTEPGTGDAAFKKTCHMCLIALEPDNDRAVCYNRSQYIWGNALGYRHRQNVDENEPDYIRVYSPEGVSDMMRRGRDNGYFVIYNHPSWSLEAYPEYISYNGMHAMEIVNFSCYNQGYTDENEHCYDDMLRSGKRIFCVAADDNHNASPDDGPYCDSFGGYTMIAAASLDYREITAALENGMFYASRGSNTRMGPEILSLVYENGTVRIKTSPVRSISYMTASRRCSCRLAQDGSRITEAVFPVAQDEVWFRLTATDGEGYKAYTNAYFPASF